MFRAWGGGGWSEAGRAQAAPSAGWQVSPGRPGFEGFFKEEILLNLTDVPSNPLLWVPQSLHVVPAALLAWPADSSVLPTDQGPSMRHLRVRASTLRPQLWTDELGVVFQVGALQVP